MKTKSLVKMFVDIFMTFLMLFCMAGLLVGEVLHEVFGSVLLVLFIIHNILNYKWYASLFKGKYTALRITQTIINFASLITLVAQGISGIVLSNHLFAFLQIESGFALARSVHLACGYWCFLFVSLHLGFHWSMILSKIHFNALNKVLLLISRLIVACLCGLGIYFFIKNQLYTYMLLLTHFAFFDFEQPIVLFYSEYICIMALFVAVGYYLRKLVTKKISRF